MPKLSNEEVKSIVDSVLNNEINITQGNDSIGLSRNDFIQLAKDSADRVPFLSEKIKSEIIGDKAEKIGQAKIISSLKEMLRRHKYCVEKNLDCEDLFGFSIVPSGKGMKNYKFQLLDSNRAKNSFERLRYFEPSTAKWLKNPNIIESERSERPIDKADTQSIKEISYKHGFRIGDYCSLKNLRIVRVEKIVEVYESILIVDNGYGGQKIYKIDDLEKVSKKEAEKIIKS